MAIPEKNTQNNNFPMGEHSVKKIRSVQRWCDEMTYFQWIDTTIIPGLGMAIPPKLTHTQKAITFPWGKIPLKIPSVQTWCDEMTYFQWIDTTNILGLLSDPCRLDVMRWHISNELTLQTYLGYYPIRADLMWWDDIFPMNWHYNHTWTIIQSMRRWCDVMRWLIFN